MFAQMVCSDEDALEMDWEVRRILGRRKLRNGIIQYKVKFYAHKGIEYDLEWMDNKDLNCSEKIQEFERLIKNKEKTSFVSTYDA